MFVALSGWAGIARLLWSDWSRVAGEMLDARLRELNGRRRHYVAVSNQADRPPSPGTRPSLDPKQFAEDQNRRRREARAAVEKVDWEIAEVKAHGFRQGESEGRVSFTKATWWLVAFLLSVVLLALVGVTGFILGSGAA